jgi:hypothetical protein
MGGDAAGDGGRTIYGSMYDASEFGNRQEVALGAAQEAAQYRIEVRECGPGFLVLAEGNPTRR